MNKNSLFIVIVMLLCLALGCNWFGGDPTTETDSNTVTEQPEKFPDAPSAYEAGVKLLEQGDTEKAVDALLQAVDHDPDHADAFFRLGIAYALLEFSSDPEASATPLPGEIRTDEKEMANSKLAFEKAVKAYRKRLESNKDDHSAQFNLGRSLLKLNRDEEASRALQQAVRLNPDDTEYQTQLGSALMNLAKYAEAERAFRKALELDENNVEAEELLERAEAGRKRIDFVKLPDDDKKKDPNANANANTSASKTDNLPKPDPTPTKPAPTPLQ